MIRITILIMVGRMILHPKVGFKPRCTLVFRRPQISTLSEVKEKSTWYQASGWSQTRPSSLRFTFLTSKYSCVFWNICSENWRTLLYSEFTATRSCVPRRSNETKPYFPKVYATPAVSSAHSLCMFICLGRNIVGILIIFTLTFDQE